ncbi:hypothetical protein [Pendulispora albinea]|uniref:Signal transduction histidine kinase dimerisation/phosphoacceptor domain-containing protein n=1 Tax=Pendulispora albinea TaxID=2741071 RepID=A0ABZ2MBY2_9BACT
MHSLRHDVRSRLHLAGAAELKEWQKLEPDTMEIERQSVSEGLRANLESVIARLARLRAAIDQGIPSSKGH